jgi:prepilin-type N-terminal cleavage/methylation domain-containing protein
MSSIVNKTKHSAFTLIELLVVIAIIALLATFSVIALGSARAKSRDAKRLADIKNTQTALDLYYNEYGVYPTGVEGMDQTSTSYCLSDQGIATTCGEVIYAGSLPTDPINGLNYSYVPISSQFSYTVIFTLDSGTGGYEAGDYTATPNGIVSWACGDSVSFIYNGSSITYGTVSSSNECWLDRDLGATRPAESSTDFLAYGDLFQWGRGDDRHQGIAWTGSATGTPDYTTTTTLATSDTPGHYWFITKSSSPADWRFDNNTNRWNANPIINNPCPSGFRIPTDVELDDERETWGSSQNSVGAFDSPLKLTVAGYRSSSNGSLNLLGFSAGYYWSSTVDGTGSHRLNFNSDDAGIYNGSRANGYAVRCIKD